LYLNTKYKIHFEFASNTKYKIHRMYFKYVFEILIFEILYNSAHALFATTTETRQPLAI